jgi:hypothetical protein
MGRINERQAVSAYHHGPSNLGRVGRYRPHRGHRRVAGIPVTPDLDPDAVYGRADKMIGRVLGESYVDQRASRLKGRKVVRSVDDEDDEREVDHDLEVDPEDFSTVDDHLLKGATYLKNFDPRGGFETEQDVLDNMRSGLEYDSPVSGLRVRKSPPISDRELLAAANDLYDRHAALHARYKQPNKIQGNVSEFIRRARKKKGLS